MRPSLKTTLLSSFALAGAFVAGRYTRPTSQMVADYRSLDAVRSISFDPVTVVTSPLDPLQTGEVVRAFVVQDDNAQRTVYSRPVADVTDWTRTNGTKTFIVPMNLNGVSLRLAVAIPLDRETKNELSVSSRP